MTPPDMAAQLAEALKDIDWQQVVLNGGPPCFHIENGRFCLRAERWMGHHTSGFHEYVTLPELFTAVTKERDELSRQLEFDRTAVADCITAANRELDSRHWLTEGRGSYEWDDDQYRGEFLSAGIAIKAAITPLTKIAADWKGCPTTGEAIRAARRDLQAERDALATDNARLRDALKLADDHLDPVHPESCRIWDITPSCTCGVQAAQLAVTQALSAPAPDAVELVQAERELVEASLAYNAGVTFDGHRLVQLYDDWTRACDAYRALRAKIDGAR
jgi:hypothetical protein